MLMTVVSIPLFQDPLFSIVSENSEHLYVSRPFVLLGCIAMLGVRALGPLFLVQYHVYRMRPTPTRPTVLAR